MTLPPRGRCQGSRIRQASPARTQRSWGWRDHVPLCGETNRNAGHARPIVSGGSVSVREIAQSMSRPKSARRVRSAGMSTDAGATNSMAAKNTGGAPSMIRVERSTTLIDSAASSPVTAATIPSRSAPRTCREKPSALDDFSQPLVGFGVGIHVDAQPLRGRDADQSRAERVLRARRRRHNQHHCERALEQPHRRVLDVAARIRHRAGDSRHNPRPVLA